MSDRNGAASAWKVGDVIEGLYRVDQVHEAGGMGLVYRVWHLGWGTDLAVKSPRPELFRSARERELFVAEAQTWVGLGLHPHVCACHYVREIGGTPRVFAEYLDGGSLSELIHSGRLYAGGPEQALARILDLAVQAARGLDHAHQQGVVHQDVKPGNILLDRDGTARITDFGLARAGQLAAWPGGAGDRPGADATVLVAAGGMTRVYASPEQYGQRQLGRRSDLYSFAVSVLEMFTGGVAWYVGPLASETLAAFRGTRGRDGRPPIPPGVAELLERCLRHDPAQRPASMAEVAAELAEHYHRATGTRYARPVPSAVGLRADELNNRGLSLFDLEDIPGAQRAFADALEADPRHLDAAYNGGLLRWRRGETTDDTLVADLEQLRLVHGDSWQSRHRLTEVHLERGDLEAARELLAGITAECGDDPERRAAVERLDLSSAPDNRAAPAFTARWYQLFDGPARLAARITPDGRYAVTGYGGHGDKDRGLKLWDLRRGELLRTVGGLESWVSSLDVSDGRYAVSVGPDNEVRFWDLARERCLLAFTPPGRRELFRVQALRIDNRARTAVAVVEGRLLVWDFPSGRQRLRLGPVTDRAEDSHRVELSHDGGLALVSSHARGTLQLWDLNTGELRQTMTMPGRGPTAIWLEPEGRTAATASPGLTIRLWDLRSGRAVRTVTSPIGEVRSLVLSGDSRYAVTGGEDGAVRLWDLALYRCVRTFREHSQPVAAVMMGGDADWAVSAGQDNTARWWRITPERRFRASMQLSRPRRHQEIERAGGQVGALLAEAEQALGSRQHAAALDLLTRARSTPGYERAPEVLAAWRRLGRSVRRTGLRGAWPVHTLGGQGHVSSLAVSADGRTAAIGGDRRVGLWNPTDGTPLRALDKPRVGSVGLSADGLRAVAGGDAVLQSWELPGGRPLGRVDARGPDGRAESGEEGMLGNSVLFTADARQALVIGRDGALRLWDLDSGRCVRVLTGDGERPTTAAAMSADGTRAASVALFGEIQLHARLGAPPLALSHPACGWLSFDADGHRLLSGSVYGDRSLRLWDAGTGQFLRAFDFEVLPWDAGTGPDELSVLHLSAGGRFAYTGHRLGTVRIWDADTGRCLRELEGGGGQVWSLTATADDSLLLFGCADGSVRAWALDWELSAGQ
ncbi:protein kinase domain-containing protein [Kitasatospora sp. NPDC001119]